MMSNMSVHQDINSSDPVQTLISKYIQHDLTHQIKTGY